MADVPVATKAPESDTTETVAPGDAPAQPSATLSEHCVTDRPTRQFHLGECRPQGWYADAECSRRSGLDRRDSKARWCRCLPPLTSNAPLQSSPKQVYISKPSDYPHAPAQLLLLLTGGTGLKSTNNQIQADKFASEGFVVVMPDLFDGDAAPNSTAIPEEEATGSILDTFKIKAVETAKSFMIDSMQLLAFPSPLWASSGEQSPLSLPDLCPLSFS